MRVRPAGPGDGGPACSSGRGWPGGHLGRPGRARGGLEVVAGAVEAETGDQFRADPDHLVHFPGHPRAQHPLVAGDLFRLAHELRHPGDYHAPAEMAVRVDRVGLVGHHGALRVATVTTAAPRWLRMITFPSSIMWLTGRIAGIACIVNTIRPSDTVPSSRRDSPRLSSVSRRSPLTVHVCSARSRE